MEGHVVQGHVKCGRRPGAVPAPADRALPACAVVSAVFVLHGWGV